MMNQIEEMREALSTEESFDYSFENITTGLDLVIPVSRKKFEKYIELFLGELDHFLKQSLQIFNKEVARKYICKCILWYFIILLFLFRIRIRNAEVWGRHIRH